MMLEIPSGPEAMSMLKFTSSFKMSDAEHATEEMNSFSGRQGVSTKKVVG